MNVAFIVQIETSDTDFLSLSNEIEDVLTKAGLDIIIVHPWSRSTQPTVTNNPLAIQPNPAGGSGI